MKTNWYFLLIAIFGMVVLQSCEDDDDNGLKVSEELQKALRERYPEAKNVEWETKAGYYVAECWNNGAETDVWFSTDASWKMTETDLGIDVNRLPAPVKETFLAGQYATWGVDDIDKYEREDLTFYLVEVEKKGQKDMDLYYTEDGTVLKEVEDRPNDDVLPTTSF